MMNFGLFEAIVVSIPQLVAHLLFGLLILNEKILDRKVRILAVCILFALASLGIRNLSIDVAYHIFISYGVLVLLNGLLLGLSPWRSIIITIIVYLETTIVESIYWPIVIAVTGLNFQTIFASPLLFHTLVGLYNLLLFGIAYLAYHFRWNVRHWEELLFQRTKTNRIVPVLVLMVSFLTTVIGILVIHLLTADSLSDGSDFVRILTLILIVGLIASTYMIKKMLDFAQQHAANMAQEAYIENINELVTSIRSQRHDFLNHLQTIYGLCQVKRIDDLKDYIGNLIGEVREIETVVSVKNPALAALLRSKLAKAEVNDIQLTIRVLSPMENCKIKPFELVKIFGNLIDNAIDAVDKLAKGERWINLDINQNESNYIITISNGGDPIPAELSEKIFESGFSTKGTGSHSGIGLPTVRQLIQNYHGSIRLDETASHPTFILRIPV